MATKWCTAAWKGLSLTVHFIVRMLLIVFALHLLIRQSIVGVCGQLYLRGTIQFFQCWFKICLTLIWLNLSLAYIQGLSGINLLAVHDFLRVLARYLGGNLIHHIILMGWFGTPFDLIDHLFDLPEYIHVKLVLKIKSLILIRPGQALWTTVSGILVCLCESLGLFPIIKLVDLL